jgi:nucleotide-binding universal stress UspA family protein
MKKMLVAIDGSKGGLKAVEYVGQQFAGMSDMRMTLFHVLPGVAPELWDDGHVLTEEEKTARNVVLDKWLANQKLKLDPIFQTAIETLTRNGINPEQIETKSISGSAAKVTDCLLTEAKTGGYQTLVLGRCGHSPAAHFFMGSIANRIINHGAGIAICVVE